MASDRDSGRTSRGTNYDGATQTALGELSVMLKHMDLACECKALDMEEGRLNIEIFGDDAHLLGQDGATLDALQYLLYVVVARSMGERYSISIDADGYRERRRQELEAYANDLADQAVAAGQEAVLDPLWPHERRIVHLALRGRDDVETYSEGEEPYRRLVICPKG